VGQSLWAWLLPTTLQTDRLAGMPSPSDITLMMAGREDYSLDLIGEMAGREDYSLDLIIRQMGKWRVGRIIH